MEKVHDTFDVKRMRTWVRPDGSESSEYIVDDDEIVAVEVLRKIVAHELRFSITSGSAQDLSLAFLEPVIADIGDLWVNTTARLAGIEVLDRAVKLRSLCVEVKSCSGQADLSGLPHLDQFEGTLSNAVASVLSNPSLRYISLFGAIPKSFARIVGPVEVFIQEGGRAQIELPVFLQPHALRVLTRVGPRTFDLAQLDGMPGLEQFELALCGDVVSLRTLARLPKLKRVTFKACSTAEEWEELPSVPEAMLMDLSPPPSREFLTRRREAGWIVPVDAGVATEPALVLDKAGDGESWGVFMSRFEDLADVVEELEGAPATGLHGEAFLLGVVSELRDQGVELVAEPDSDIETTVVYFPDFVQAERVFSRATKLLDADTATQLSYVQKGTAFGSRDAI